MKKIKRVLCTVVTTCLMLSSMAVPTMAETHTYDCYLGGSVTKSIDTNSGKIYLSMRVVEQSFLNGHDGYWRASATGDAKVATHVSFGMNYNYTNVLSTCDLTKVRSKSVTSRARVVYTAHARLNW